MFMYPYKLFIIFSKHKQPSSVEISTNLTLNTVKKKRLSYILISFIAISSFSCLRDNQVIYENTGSIENVVIAQDFNWKSTKDISIYINATSSMVIEIRSEDGNQILHKGFYRATENSSYIARITVPSYFKKLQINNSLVDICDDDITT